MTENYLHLPTSRKTYWRFKSIVVSSFLMQTMMFKTVLARSVFAKLLCCVDFNSGTKLPIVLVLCSLVLVF